MDAFGGPSGALGELRDRALRQQRNGYAVRALSGQVAQHPPQRMVAPKFVVAIGQNEHDRNLPHATPYVLDEVERRFVGPLQVFQRQHRHLLRVAQVRQQRRKQLDGAVAPRGWRRRAPAAGRRSDRRAGRADAARTAPRSRRKGRTSAGNAVARSARRVRSCRSPPRRAGRSSLPRASAARHRAPSPSDAAPRRARAACPPSPARRSTRRAGCCSARP